MVKPPAWERSAWVEVGLAQVWMIYKKCITVCFIYRFFFLLQSFSLKRKYLKQNSFNKLINVLNSLDWQTYFYPIVVGNKVYLTI